MTDRLQQKAEEIVRELAGEPTWKSDFLRQSLWYRMALAGLTAGIAMAAEACEEPIKFAGGPSPSTKQAWRDCAYAIRALAKGQTQ